MNRGICEHCGEYRYLQKHHRVLQCQGGTDDPNNIEQLCYDCHYDAHVILKTAGIGVRSYGRSKFVKAKKSKEPNMKVHPLIQRIKDKQESEGLTLTQMSEKLGVAVSYLSMVYSGKRPPANKLLRGIVKHYPELTNLVSLFLLDDITDSAKVLETDA